MILAKLRTGLTLSLAVGVAAEQVTFGPKSTSKDTVINTEFSNYVKHLMDIWEVKGIALSVVRPDGEVEYGTWGNRTEDGESVTPDTLFNIASCSKAFLAASMGILMDDFAVGANETALPVGVSGFDWRTKVKDILPGEWELQDAWASEKANLQDILSHVSGLPRHDGSYGPSDSPADVVRRMRHLRPESELRQMWSYNNQMYMAGAHIISTYAGSYMRYATERIFKPLGMNYTTFSLDEAAYTGLLTQTWTPHGRRIPYALPEATKELNAGPGGIITNVIDLSKWMKMLLNSGVDPVTNVTVVPKAAFEAATTSHALVTGRGTQISSLVGYGMGWMRGSYQGHEIIQHGGAIPGFSSLVSFYAHDSLGVSVLINNGDKAEVTQALTFRIIEDVLKLQRTPRDSPAAKPKPPHLPENTTTPIPLSGYAGTYGNAGYGSITLCHPASNSFYCEDVLADFRAVDKSHPSLEKDVPQLYAAWDRIGADHVRLVLSADNIFNAWPTALFPNGYGADKTPFETADMDKHVGAVEFVVEDGKVTGFGLFVQMDVKGVGRVQERADAWFHKV